MWVVFSVLRLNSRLGWLLLGQGVPSTTRSWAQTSATTAPCLYRWAPAREPTRAARTLAWDGRSLTPSTVQKLQRLTMTKTGPVSPATTSRITKMRATKVTRKRSRCTKTMGRITKRKEGKENASRRVLLENLQAGSLFLYPQEVAPLFFVCFVFFAGGGVQILFSIVYYSFLTPFVCMRSLLHISWWTVFLWSCI